MGSIDTYSFYPRARPSIIKTWILSIIMLFHKEGDCRPWNCIAPSCSFIKTPKSINPETQRVICSSSCLCYWICAHVHIYPHLLFVRFIWQWSCSIHTNLSLKIILSSMRHVQCPSFYISSCSILL
jgi:hypothetical protein